MSKRAWREQAIITAKSIQDARNDERLMAYLTAEEQDWLLILEERLFAAYNRRLPTVGTGYMEPV